VWLEDARQWRPRRQPVLQSEAVGAELEGHPSVQTIGREQQAVNGLTDHGTGIARPRALLDDVARHEPKLVAVELDRGPDPAGEHPFTVTFVDQVVVAVAFWQRRHQFGNHVRRPHTRGQLHRRRGIVGTGLDTHLRHEVNLA
jgi:hypothetical protein